MSVPQSEKVARANLAKPGSAVRPHRGRAESAKHGLLQTHHTRITSGTQGLARSKL